MLQCNSNPLLQLFATIRMQCYIKRNIMGAFKIGSNFWSSSKRGGGGQKIMQNYRNRLKLVIIFGLRPLSVILNKTEMLIVFDISLSQLFDLIKRIKDLKRMPGISRLSFIRKAWETRCRTAAICTISFSQTVHYIIFLISYAMHCALCIVHW